MTRRVDPGDLVTLADIGRRLNLSRQRAHQLADDSGFPASIGKLGNYTVYRWSDVDRWARRSGRITSDETDIRALGLSSRTLHPLLRVGFVTAGDVVAAGRPALERIPNFSRMQIAAVVQALAARGLTLGE
jgi:hypothetical protein